MMSTPEDASPERALLARVERAIGSHTHALAFYNLATRQWRINRGWRSLSALAPNATGPQPRATSALGQLLQRGSRQVRQNARPLLLWSPACLKPPARAPMRWQLRFTPIHFESRLVGIVCRLHLRSSWRGLAGQLTMVPWFLPAHPHEAQHAELAAHQHVRALTPGVKETVHPHDCDSFLHALRQAHEAAAPFAIDCRLRLPHGPYHWHRIVGRPERGPGGAVIGWLGGSQDRQHHTDACRMRRAFLRLASHELNTPLTSLMLNLQLALSRAGGQTPAASRATVAPDATLQASPPIAPLLHRALEQARKLGQTVETLLDVQGLVAGPLPLHREPANVTVLLTGALKTVEPLLLQAGCRVSLAIDDDLRCSVDSGRISEVFFHLLSNVAKFAPGSLLTIEGHQDDRGVHIAVHDDGPGIGKGDARQIFELFGRGRVSRSTSGLGIGLYLCRRIVRAHGGRLSLDLQAERGAHFFLHLPSHAHKASVSAQGSVSTAQAAMQSPCGAADDPPVLPALGDEAAIACRPKPRSSSSL